MRKFFGNLTAMEYVVIGVIAFVGICFVVAISTARLPEDYQFNAATGTSTWTENGRTFMKDPNGNVRELSGDKP